MPKGWSNVNAQLFVSILRGRIDSRHFIVHMNINHEMSILGAGAGLTVDISQCTCMNCQLWNINPQGEDWQYTFHTVRELSIMKHQSSGEGKIDSTHFTVHVNCQYWNINSGEELCSPSISMLAMGLQLVYYNAVPSISRTLLNLRLFETILMMLQLTIRICWKPIYIG